MHAEAFGFVARAAPVLARRVLEVGGRDVNGSIRGLFLGGTYVSTDIAPGQGVDCVADGQRLPFGDGAFDCIVCCEVFEHTPVWPAILHECFRVAEPRGQMVVTCAGAGRGPHSGIDGGDVREGEYYANLQTFELMLEATEAGWDVEQVRYNDRSFDIYALLVRR